MASNVMEHFGPLDELIQVIYQGLEKYVLLSDVTTSKWQIHLGLTGANARWWQGSWTSDDVLGVVGHSASATLLSTYAGNLAENIVQGELHVDEAQPYKLVLNPTGKKPIQVTLKEMSAGEALEYTTEAFANIALQAQSRQSRLNPSAVAFPTPGPAVASIPPNVKTEKKPSLDVPEPPVAPKQRKPAPVEAPQSPQKKRVSEDVAPRASSSKAAAVRSAPKGASLANPNKKARKFQAIEFESDEE
ncbi:hypothetical protein MIND_00039100 [Mycena indigotica]|uniref:Uncharacterized protein n=1 Tax=Mycena indigotica TaxID=2126181 RepID=A0A8H6TEF7_9AGAR|nr:uncharacterized protein MIND_00039100 [Mycena indigotica]KAF7315247.1 hypothetical protein MIND_00039100 [Mycena indigotica]